MLHRVLAHHKETNKIVITVTNNDEQTKTTINRDENNMKPEMDELEQNNKQTHRKIDNQANRTPTGKQTNQKQDTK